MEKIQDILSLELWQQELLGNTLGAFAVAFGAFLGFLILFKLIEALITKKLKKLAAKTKTDIDDTLIEIVHTLKPPFYLYVSFYFALGFIHLSGTVEKIVNAILIIWIVYQAIIAAQLFINYLVTKGLDRDDTPNAKSAISLINIVVKGVLWGVGLLFILSNLGVNVTSFIAGLGIGGIAIALALQNVLTDLFSSVAIYFDKPFEIGDFIVVGDKKGTVEKIGLKTTRIASIHGEEIVISNQELTSVQILNYKKMKERRGSLSFGVTYNTPVETLKKIPAIIEDILSEIENARFDRVSFSNFGDSSLDFNLVYYVLSAEYIEYTRAHQQLLFRILEEFEKMKIEMAFPTRTIYMEKS